MDNLDTDILKNGIDRAIILTVEALTKPENTVSDIWYINDSIEKLIDTRLRFTRRSEKSQDIEVKTVIDTNGNRVRDIKAETVDTVKQGELMGYSRETINEYLYGKDGIG
jgi:hypothetical protein